MAGDWIKIELITPDKPEVVQMAALLRIDQDAVFGKLFRVWAWADQNSVDGSGMKITAAFIDRLTSKRGFADALRTVDWLKGDDCDLMFPNFGRHNGATAKARAETNRRVANHRERNAVNVTNVTPPPLQDALLKPLPEKRREEKNTEIEEEEGSASPASDLTLEGEQAMPADPVWTKETGWQGVTDTHRQRWALAYPACDITRQFAQMDVWLRANPTESHKSNWLRFITNWLKREQDKGGDNRSDRRGGASPTGGRPAGSGPVPWQRKTHEIDHSKGF